MSGILLYQSYQIYYIIINITFILRPRDYVKIIDDYSFFFYYIYFFIERHTRYIRYNIDIFNFENKNTVCDFSHFNIFDFNIIIFCSMFLIPHHRPSNDILYRYNVLHSRQKAHAGEFDYVNIQYLSLYNSNPKHMHNKKFIFHISFSILRLYFKTKLCFRGGFSFHFTVIRTRVRPGFAVPLPLPVVCLPFGLP